MLLESSRHDKNYAQSAQNVSWILQKVWLSIGLKEENIGRYYAHTEVDTTYYKIYFYTMMFRGTPTSEDGLQTCKGFNKLFGRSLISSVGAIIELDNYCRRYSRNKKRVNVALARLPSPYASRHFFASYMAAVRDTANDFIRAAMANALTVYWDLGKARRYREGEGEADQDKD